MQLDDRFRGQSERECIQSAHAEDEEQKFASSFSLSFISLINIGGLR
jgi:hypothetical protein